MSARLRRLYERPFWGRETLLDAVRRPLTSPGENVLLVGPGGVGKTSLAIAALRALAKAQPALRIVHVTATEGARATPLGAFDAVLGDVDRDSLGGTPDAVGKAVIAACLSSDAPGYGATGAKANQLVLHVDDSPDLDELSAAVVDYLISRVDVRVVITCRSIPGPSATLVRAVRDELVNRVDVPPLSFEESVAFAAAGLPDKPLAPDSVRRMHEVTGGNALFLSELLRSVDATGALEERLGLWVWTAPLPLGTSLDDLLRVEIDHLTPAKRRAFEVVALTAPAAIDLLIPVVSGAALAELADDGWITFTEPAGAGATLVGLTQPLYGEAMTALTTTSAVGTTYLALYDSAVSRFAAADLPGPEHSGDLPTVEDVWRGDASDLVTVVGWGLRTSSTVPIALLAAAFRYGRGLTDYAFRIRITGALLRHPDASAVLRALALINRAEAFRFTNRPNEVGEDTVRCRALIDALPPGAERTALAASLATVAADSLVLQQGRWQEALEILDWADEKIVDGDPAVRARLDASRGIYLAFGGRMDAMTDLADELHRSAKGTSSFLPLASTLILALGQRGQSKRARALARAQMTHAATAMAEHPLAAGEIVGAWCLADMFLGHPREASFIYGLMNTAAARNPGGVRMRATLIAFGRGLLAVVGAEWTEAAQHLTVASSELDDFTGTGSEGLLMASLALAHAATGDHEASLAAREKLASWPMQTSSLLEAPTRYFLLLASLYAPTGGEADEARALVARAREFGFSLMELRALHALAMAERGASEADLARADDIVAAVDAPIAGPLRDSMRAIADGEPPASGDAARVLARRGLLVPTPQHSALTAREHQLAEFFALGYSNAQIAKKLHVSKRTIESHAAHIFQKLHINSREDVGDALDRDRDR